METSHGNDGNGEEKHMILNGGNVTPGVRPERNKRGETGIVTRLDATAPGCFRLLLQHSPSSLEQPESRGEVLDLQGWERLG